MDTPEKELTVRQKIAAGIGLVLAIGVMTGLQVTFAKNSGNKDGEFNPPAKRGDPKVDTDRHVKVIKTAPFEEGSRLVLGQCIDGSMPSINVMRDRRDCVIESFKSEFSDPITVYSRGQTMVPNEEIIPPIKYLPYTSNR